MNDNTSLLTEARSRMAGLAEITAAIPRVQRALRDALGTTVEAVDIDAALAEVVAGAEVPDLGAEMAATRQRIEARNHQVEALQKMVSTLSYQLRDLHVDRADDALQYLAEELDRILVEARNHAGQLGGITSADAAIEQGKVDAWAAVGPLASRYAELRQAQAVIVSAALFPADQARVSDTAKGEARALVSAWGSVRNYGELYPAPGWWEFTLATERTRHLTDQVGREIPPPPWLGDDARANLAYIAGPDAEPWVPSLAELQGAKADHEQQRRKAAVEEAAGNPPKKAKDTHLHWDQTAAVRNRSSVPAGIDVP